MKTFERKLSVLHLARWYPNRDDPMPGLFIQRHAEASALWAKATVVYAHGFKPAGKKVPLYEVCEEEKNGVRTVRVYYRLPRCKITPVALLTGLFRFFCAVSKGITKARQRGEQFDVLHVHILTRLGVVALFYKWFSGVPYVITEHWGRYQLLRNEFRGVFRKTFTRIVVKNAAVVTTISEDLRKAMQYHRLYHPDYRVINNVADKVFFNVAYPDISRKGNRKELVHVSCFSDKYKNISGLLRVVKKLSENRDDFHFTLMGEGEDLDNLRAYAEKLEIPEKILTFTGLLEGRPLAEMMAKADALVIFSNYENMPVVINESFVLGVPVFSTDVGGIAEMVTPDRGLLVPRGDEKALMAVLTAFLDGKIDFDRAGIRRFGRKRFSPEAVGNDLLKIYRDAVGKG